MADGFMAEILWLRAAGTCLTNLRCIRNTAQW
jgi:hypothetical protein